ncbi:unnamed protein product [Penicillium roqueforti FM164]|uniref:Genomic scaffold, ProqFM164S01 n=1 Tax=Penicillium roqueforti (strain FM164) TaxID=1365484 RepID=W6Q5I4_PENRF|nr:unnamed protein product [Penicillium roqueforti FM164]
MELEVSNSLHASVEIASGLNITNEALEVQCRAAAQIKLSFLLIG